MRVILIGGSSHAGKSILYNQKMMAAIHRLGLTSIEVSAQDSLGELADHCLEVLHA